MVDSVQQPVFPLYEKWRTSRQKRILRLPSQIRAINSHIPGPQRVGLCHSPHARSTYTYMAKLTALLFIPDVSVKMVQEVVENVDQQRLHRVSQIDPIKRYDFQCAPFTGLFGG